MAKESLSKVNRFSLPKGRGQQRDAWQARDGTASTHTTRPETTGRFCGYTHHPVGALRALYSYLSDDRLAEVHQLEPSRQHMPLKPPVAA